MNLDEKTHRFLSGSEATEALRIIARLRESGFTAYMAGGCVRDALLGKSPKDYDVATDATPDSVREVFGRSRTLSFGASFGVIGVLPPHGKERMPNAPVQNAPEQNSRPQDSQGDESHGQAISIQPTEVATFRSDGSYTDGRRPDSVHFGDAKHDALRRDFTINGLFYDPEVEEIIDFVDGQADLAAGILRTIGDPLARFGEDKLRMLRAVRFATTLGFTLEASTLRAIIEHADEIETVSAERIGAEMRRVIDSEQAVGGLRNLIVTGLHRTVLPESTEIDLNRADAMLLHAPPPQFPLRLACLLNLAKDCRQSLRAITRRWRLSNEETRRAAAALQQWPKILKTTSLAWSEIQPILTDRDADAIVGLATAIAAVDQTGMQDAAAAREALQWPEDRLDPPPLLTGNDLRELGIPAGPEYQVILTRTRRDQLDGKLATKEEAIAQLGLD